MEFVLLINGSAEAYAALATAEGEKLYAEHLAFMDAVKAAGIAMPCSAELEWGDRARTVRHVGDRQFVTPPERGIAPAPAPRRRGGRRRAGQYGAETSRRPAARPASASVASRSRAASSGSPVWNDADAETAAAAAITSSSYRVTPVSS
jgi:hypothetical protein